LLQVDYCRRPGQEEKYNGRESICAGLLFDQSGPGWAAPAGTEVCDYIEKNSGWFPLIHVKECDHVAKDPAELDYKFLRNL